MRALVAAFSLISFLAPAVPAQRVDPANRGHRVWVLDRVVTDARGVRMPQHVQGNTALSFVVLAWHPSGKFCLVEYAANADTAFALLRQDAARDPLIRVFEKHMTRKEVVAEAARTAGFPAIDFSKSFVRPR